VQFRRVSLGATVGSESRSEEILFGLDELMRSGPAIATCDDSDNVQQRYNRNRHDAYTTGICIYICTAAVYVKDADLFMRRSHRGSKQVPARLSVLLSSNTSTVSSAKYDVLST
jgi:hypothetical protein